MTQPRVTVLMPLKNYHPDYLRKSVRSVITQSCPHWHLLIIVEKQDFKAFGRIVEEVLRDQRIEMICNEGRRLGGALNTGMGQSRTDFVAILLADDMWTSDAVKVLGESIDQFPEVDFFHSSRIIIDENDNPISSVYYSKEQFRLEDFVRSSPVKHLLCWRKEKALSLGGMDETLNHGPDDYDFPWSMAEAGAIFRAIKESLYLYRDHRESYRLTTHVPLSVQKREIRRIMKKHGASPTSIRTKIAKAQATYLRQCLYESSSDRRVKEKLGYDPRRGWRDKYR